MNKKNFIKTLMHFLIIICAIFFILIYEDECRKGVASGILISGNIIIPSLFPFTVCILMIMRCGFTAYIEKTEKIIFKFFGLNPSEFLVFILSFIGGYPIGAKLINETVKEKNSTESRANNILLFSINGGPAFIVLAIGNGMLNSKKIGIVLLVSHITSSLIISLFTAPKLKTNYYKSRTISTKKSFSDNFVDSVANSAETILHICAFVIIFSAIGEILSAIKIIEPITYFLEITTAIRKTKNIYFISFLLGFGGISIWLQILSCCKNFKVNLFALITSRVVAGLLNATLTFIILKLFKFDCSTFSNNVLSISNFVYKTPSLTVSLILMAILLVISLERKFDSGNFKKDLV